MADCEWVILCDYAFAADGGKLCLIGIFDRVNAAAVPATHPAAAIAFGIIGEANETIDLRIQVVRPTGGVLLTLGGPAQLATSGTTRGSLMLKDITLPDFGNYGIHVYNGEELLKTMTFSVTEVPGATRSPEPGARGGPN